MNKIKEIYCKNEYKIKYLLNFEINKDIYELYNTDLQNSYNNNCELTILNNLKTITYNNSNFNNINSLIVIIDKMEKLYYIKKKLQKKT